MKSAQIIPCFGVCCEVHQDCKNYHAIEFSDPRAHRMFFCPKTPEGRTLFNPIAPGIRCVMFDRRKEER